MTQPLQLRSGTSGAPFVGAGDLDTLLWDNTLKAWYVGPGGAAGNVASVFGRVGAVVAATGDYDSDQVDNVSAVAGVTVSDALDGLASSMLTVGGVPSAGDSVKWNGSGAVWGGVAYNITSFAAVTPFVEPGATVTNPAFTSAQNKTSTSLQLTNNKTAEDKNVLSTPTAFASSAGSQALATHGASWGFSLAGTDGITPDTAAASITARQKNFAGKVTVGNTSPATLAAAASYSAFANSGAMTFTITDDGSQEWQFLRRDAYGSPAYVKDAITGFAVSFSLVATSSYTNSQGGSETFRLYRLDNPINGTKTIEVGA